MKSFALTLALAATLHAVPPEPKFRAITIDQKIQIGYGLAIADVDGDKLPDILLADKKQFVWYRNPGAEKSGDPASWAKFILAENLTKNDNVCLAAEDIDGDGKCEIAVGAEWNPSDTVNSGAVFYLIPPADRTQRWQPVKFPDVEPTTHRMRWLEYDRDKWGLVVCPLHGRENKNGQGAAVKVLLYLPPSPIDDPKGEWKSEIIDESMHLTHNFRLIKSGLLLAGKEALPFVFREKGSWEKVPGLPISQPIFPPAGVGEVDIMEVSLNIGVIATIEPMHGNQLVVYREDSTAVPRRHVLSDQLVEGHALKCGDLISGSDEQIVVGWRGTLGKEGSTCGIHLWTPLDPEGKEWRDSAVDDGGMACEDLVLADLNGDGKLDLVASGRATHNVKIYFNETPLAAP